jgi:hypothetical protein
MAQNNLFCALDNKQVIINKERRRALFINGVYQVNNEVGPVQLWCIENYFGINFHGPSL